MKTIKIGMRDLMQSPDIQVVVKCASDLRVRGWIEFMNRGCQNANCSAETLAWNEGRTDFEFWFEWDVDGIARKSENWTNVQRLLNALNNHDVPFRVE